MPDDLLAVDECRELLLVDRQAWWARWPAAGEGDDGEVCLPELRPTVPRDAPPHRELR